MKIGILGSGVVGQALGRGFANSGHEVKMGTRDPRSEKVTGWVNATGKGVSAGTFAEAAAFAELAVLCTAWSGTEQAIQLADPRNLSGKVVIDTTNPLVFSKPGQPPSLALGYTDSAGEQVQRWLPEARVVKAFNIVGNTLMVNPELPGGPPDMFICGNDIRAKDDVTKILTAWGWSVVDIGGIDGARELEPLAMIWIKHGFRTNNWAFAFKLLKK